ncbi:MAG: radical SAM protein [Thermoplasmataceae archaeon]|jgi:DNA repair photolyase
MKEIEIQEIEVKSAMGKSGLRELDYSLNPYLGCLHSCIYCYAMDFTRIRPSSEWGKYVIVKANLVDVLRKEVKRKKKGIVGVSTITDPYQPVEGRFRITRESITVLAENGFRVTVQTKSPLVIRDIDIMGKYRNSIDVGFTITTTDRKKARILEPETPSPESRVEAIKKLGESGIQTWIFYGPIIRGFNDSQIDISGMIQSAAVTGSRIIYDRYNRYPASAKKMKSLGLEQNIADEDGWWQSKEMEIRKQAERAGIICNSEDEEWEMNHRSMYGSFF